MPIIARHLERCVELAEMALEKGDEPFGSMLVSAAGETLFEARNRVVTGNPTDHPELAIAQWAAENLSPAERRQAVVYTSGEHCPMCAAAHAWAGLGKIFYASSAAQLAQWLEEFGVNAAPVRALSIADISADVEAAGPFPPFDEQVRLLHRTLHCG